MVIFLTWKSHKLQRNILAFTDHCVLLYDDPKIPSRKHYKCLTDGWKSMGAPKIPSWYDRYTRACPHPDGVIIARWLTEYWGTQVAFINIRHRKTVKLPYLQHYLASSGMAYDVNAKKLTIAGVKNDKYGSTSAVFQLSELSERATWKRLEDLPHPVFFPMVVSDKEYLYVLGGHKCTTCVRMSKEKMDKWHCFTLST